MAAYMWNGLQPVTSFTLIPNPNPKAYFQQLLEEEKLGLERLERARRKLYEVGVGV